MTRPFAFISRHAGWLAAVCCASAAIGFGGMLDGYSHAQHPLALLGANGIPRALAFNWVGFVIPGGLLAIAAAALRAKLPAGARWPARIGTHLVLFSALAFAAQGLWPLDPDELDSRASQLHASAWMFWWIAFVAGAGLLAIGLPREVSQWRGLAMAAPIAAVLVLLLVLFGSSLLPAGSSQRLAFAVWFGWSLLMARPAAGAQAGTVA